MGKNLNKKEDSLRLKSRKTWLSDGDCNSCYFHNSLQCRKGSNSICSIVSQGGNLEEVSEIKEFVFLSFQELIPREGKKETET